MSCNKFLNLDYLFYYIYGCKIFQSCSYKFSLDFVCCEINLDFFFSPLKRILDGRKAQDKTRWLNSPNVYQKVEVLETGTPDPKKITKVEIVTVENA